MTIQECRIAHKFTIVRIKLLRIEIPVSLSLRGKAPNNQLTSSLYNFRLGETCVTGQLPDKGMKFNKLKTFGESALPLNKI